MDDEPAKPETFTRSTELEERPQSRREWSGIWRSLVLPLLVVAAIVGAIWYLESGGLPGLRRTNDATGAVDPNGTYYSLESQGIKLGAAGGTPPKKGEPAPDFALLDLNGKVVHLSDFRGKTVVLNFWATWCIPCRREFPRLVRAYEQNKDSGLVVLGVDLEETPDQVRKFANQWGAEYPIVIDKGGSVASQYRIVGLPVTWFIDSQGIARAQLIGELTDELLRSYVAQTGFTLK